MDTKESTPRLVIKGRCKGEDIVRWFAILLSVHGNVSIGAIR